MNSYHIIKDVFRSSPKIVGESFYIGSRPETRFGDIFSLQEKGVVKFRANILDESEGFIKDSKRRNLIEKSLTSTTFSDLVLVSLNGSITFKNSLDLDNDAGRPGIPALGDIGSFTLEVLPNAYSIQCDGKWESLQSVEGIVNDLTKREKLNTMIKDITTPYFMVTGIFKTSSQFISLIASDTSNTLKNVTIETNNSDSAGFYRQLSEQINNYYPDSFTIKPAPTIPFVRAVRVRPLWENEGTLQDRPPPPEYEATRVGTARKPKPLPQADNMQLEKATLPELKLPVGY